MGDFGCGTGRVVPLLHQLGASILAVDLSQAMLREVRQKFVDSTPMAPSPQVSLVRANLVELEGFADDIVDHGVCLFATLGMIRGRENRRRFLAHARRLIRPGGRLLLHVHHRWAGLIERGGWRAMCRSAIARDMELGDAVYAYRGIGEMFMHRFGKRELIADLRASGWQTVEVSRIGITGESIARPWQPAGGFLVAAAG